MARDNNGLVLGGEKATLETPDGKAAIIQVLQGTLPWWRRRRPG